ncbi:hypothetical protein C8J57DRAFT_1356577 [Mycena rebaudengoi]|nr:hypothetical protein C8J57DRAFT_1480177 [Mycena rebaudengoi]KAJ7249300.1 hypothetical protein C8J57DRAFT_1356577 [Mycena rebaudengoi]
MLSARPAHLQTDGRLVTKTPGRENSRNHGAMTGNSRGKNAPLQPTTLQPLKVYQNTASKSLTRVVTGPLLDKTPFPNRDAPNKFNTPLPGENKLAKLVLHDTNVTSLRPHTTPDSVARPSSTRRHVRAPRVSTNFETPITKGNHWDVSELETFAPEVTELTMPPSPQSDDNDEIEYMPPKAPEESYTPPFDLPDYSSVGATLLNLAHSFPSDDTPPVEIEPSVDLCPWDMFALPVPVTDDPFLEATKGPLLASNALPSIMVPKRRAGPASSTSQPVVRANGRSIASRSATTSTVAPKPSSNTSRLGTSAAKRPLVHSRSQSTANTNLVPGTKRIQVQATRRPVTANSMYSTKKPEHPRKLAVEDQIFVASSSDAVEDEFIFDV